MYGDEETQRMVVDALNELTEIVSDPACSEEEFWSRLKQLANFVKTL